MKLTPIFLIVAQASPPAVVLSITPVVPAVAQLTPDNTLGAESSVVTPVNQTTDSIDGGAAQGSNLFHSFSDFNVDTGRTVYFANPTGIENIMTRVTGGNASNINGTLGVLGDANLFLINPNGIIFGPDARLDISGSFFATTGDSIKLGEEGIFSATNIDGSQLLNVKPEAIFTNAMANHMAQLNSQAGLAVGPGSTLALHGGEVTISGELGGGEVEVRGNNINIGPGGINLAAPDVLWQANNDITVNSDVTGSGGNGLTLESGRSIEIAENRIINLDGGDISALINDEKAVAEARDNGAAQFVMRPGSQILTNGGDVTVDHGTFGNIAVGEVRLDESIINAGGGDIEVTATGIDRNISFNSGMHILNGAVLETIAGGNINLRGTGGRGTGDNHGILMQSEARISAVDGEISITAEGGKGTSSANTGLRLRSGSAIESTGSGNITVTGIGGTGTNAVDAIILRDRNVRISSVDGNIVMTGTSSGGTRILNHGVNIQGIVESTGSGNITITGTAVTGTNRNEGIILTDGIISSASGNIDLFGRGGGTGNSNEGIALFDASKVESFGGNITLTAIGAEGSGGIKIDDSSINATQIGGTRTESILSTAQIAINNSQAEGNGPVNLLVGPSEIAIGSQSTSGTITITGVGAFSAPLTVLAPGENGAIDTTGATLQGFENATFTLGANSDISVGNIYSPTGTIAIESVNGTVNSTGVLVDRDNIMGENIPLVPDGSLFGESSQIVAIDENNDRISGGAKRGNNLLHSFEQFNIKTGRGVLFGNPEGIGNILSRITGNEPSEIFGTLGVEGDANLFLLNPNGILFAPGSSLNLEGNFIATTADAARWDNGEIFSSNPSSAIPSGLLNINPEALLFDSQRGEITSQTILKAPGTLSLVGGNVTLGGNFLLENNSIPVVSTATARRVELAAIASGEWMLANDADQFLVANDPMVSTSNIALENASITRPIGGQVSEIVMFALGDITTTGTLNSRGHISLTASGDITTTDPIDSAGGDISLRASGNITTTDDLVPRNGNVTIIAESIRLENADIDTESLSSQQPDSMKIEASRSLTLENVDIRSVSWGEKL